MACEPDGDLKRNEVAASIHLVDKETWDEALSMKHLHFEQAVIAILPATRVEKKLTERGSPKKIGE